METGTGTYNVRPRADCPWRRYFARSFDLSIYLLLWYAAADFVFRLRITTGLTLLGVVVGFGLMLLIEPLFLVWLGTTPGKAIFGIRVTNPGGEKLTLQQGYVRAWAVFSSGNGYSIPIYNIVRLYKSYKVCKERGEMEWDEDLEYSIRDKSPLRAVTYVICALVIGMATFLLPFASDMPMHRGELSVQHFADNMNRYMRYHGLWDDVGFSGTQADGSFAALSPNPFQLPPDFRIAEKDGVVTEVNIILEDADPLSLNTMQYWINSAFNAFVGAQKEANFFLMHFRDARPANFQGFEYNSYSLTVAGVEVIYNVEIDGHQMSDLGYYIDNADEASVINVHFTMRKIQK